MMWKRLPGLLVLLMTAVSSLSYAGGIGSHDGDVADLVDDSTAQSKDDSTAQEPVADPWMSGPLLTPGGHVASLGSLSVGNTLIYTDTIGHYNSRWHRERSVDTTQWNPTTDFTYGLFNRVDVSASFPYYFNSERGESASNIGDIGVKLGFQILRDDPHTGRPALKLTVAELFPTGTYDRLNPARKGTDAFGSGAYQTSVGLTLQKLWRLSNGHFLAGRWNVTDTLPSHADLRGFNAFGGAADTDARLKLANRFTTVAALEYTLTQRWGTAIDVLYRHSAANRLSGFPGTAPDGGPASIAPLTSGDGLSIAPAVEYNFNAKTNIVAGLWFSLAGRNTSGFVSGVVSFGYAI